MHFPKCGEDSVPPTMIVSVLSPTVTKTMDSWEVRKFCLPIFIQLSLISFRTGWRMQTSLVDLASCWSLPPLHPPLLPQLYLPTLLLSLQLLCLHPRLSLQCYMLLLFQTERLYGGQDELGLLQYYCDRPIYEI